MKGRDFPIEVKDAKAGSLETACLKALAQMEEKHYADRLFADGMTAVLKYGIACHKKECMVREAAFYDK